MVSDYGILYIRISSLRFTRLHTCDNNLILNMLRVRYYYIKLDCLQTHGDR